MPNGLVAVAARLAASASAAAGPAPADDAGVAAAVDVMDPLDYAIASKKLDDPLTAALQAKTEIMTAAAAAAAARARSGRSRSRSRRIRCNKDDEDQDRCSEFGSSRFVPTAPRRSSSSLETLELSNSSETGLTGAAAGQPGLLPPQGLAGAAPAQGLGRGGGQGLGKGNWVRSEEKKDAASDDWKGCCKTPGWGCCGRDQQATAVAESQTHQCFGGTGMCFQVALDCWRLPNSCCRICHWQISGRCGGSG